MGRGCGPTWVRLLRAASRRGLSGPKGGYPTAPPGLSSSKGTTPVGIKGFLTYLLSSLWLLVASPFLCLKKRAGLLGSLLAWWRPEPPMVSIWVSWLVSSSGMMTAVSEGWDAPEISSLEEHLPTHKCMVGGRCSGVTSSPRGQAALSFLSARRPLFDQLTIKPGAEAYPDSTKGSSSQNQLPLSPFCPPTKSEANILSKYSSGRQKKLGNLISEWTCCMGLLPWQPGVGSDPWEHAGNY